MTCTRREFMAAGLTLPFLGELLAQDSKKTRACILLWMAGGPSQLDTFDPKPGTETGGEFQAIDTAVRGMRISETLPRLAKEAHRFSILRGLTSPEGDHGRGAHLMHTGYRLLEASPYPSAGSLFSHELGRNGSFPKYVTIGDRGYGPAFLGHEHAPFQIGDPATALEQIRSVGGRAEEMELMDRLQESYVRTRTNDAQRRRAAALRGLKELADTPFAKALDLAAEKEALREAYGMGAFGQGCLLARRLIEAGVKFAEVVLAGWDTHSDNFAQVRTLCNELDPAFATLLRDLGDRRLLEETVVLWMGEFGRTPVVNANNGRDHFPQISPVVVAGGPLRGGRVVGETDKSGREIRSKAVRVPDLFATLYRACGIDPQKKFFNREGKLFRPVDGGTPIADLF